MSGKLYCVGVGPGDPELMTVKAVRILEKVDAVAYPHSDKAGSEAVALQIASGACEGIENKKRIAVYVPMTRDRALIESSLREAAEQIGEELEAGSRMKELKDCGAVSGRKVMAVSNCGMENEAVYEGVDAIPDDAGYFTTVVVKPAVKKGDENG